jgi:hypothetical protein
VPIPPLACRGGLTSATRNGDEPRRARGVPEFLGSTRDADKYGMVPHPSRRAQEHFAHYFWPEERVIPGVRQLRTFDPRDAYGYDPDFGLGRFVLPLLGVTMRTLAGADGLPLLRCELPHTADAAALSKSSTV